MLFQLGKTVRIILALAGFLGAIFFPWWVPLFCMVFLSLRWRAIEVPFIGLFVDLLSLPSVGLIHPLPIFTLLGIALVWFFEPLRTRFLPA